MTQYTGWASSERNEHANIDQTALSGNHDDGLEREAHRRGASGIAERLASSGACIADPSTGSGLTRRKYSDVLLVMLLKANRSGKFAAYPRVIENRSLDDIALDPDPPKVMRGKAD